MNRMPSGASDVTTFDLSTKLVYEARQERICTECGYEREYRRVWRTDRDTFAEGRVWGPEWLRGEMRLVCLGCKPEFVVNPYERRNA